MFQGLCHAANITQRSGALLDGGIQRAFQFRVAEDVGSKVCIGIYNVFVVEEVWKAVISQVLMLIKTSTKLQPSRTKRVSGLVSALNLRL